MLARGMSLPQCSRELRRPRRTLLDIANRHGLPVRRKQLPAEKDQAIKAGLAAGYSLRRVMREVPCGSSSVIRRRALEVLNKFRRLEGRTVLPTAKWRCPGCGGMLEVDFCIRCQVKRPRSRPRPPRAQ